MGSLTPMDPSLLLAAVILSLAWGVTLRACWQHTYQRVLHGDAVSWGWLLACALVLGLGLWSAMLACLGDGAFRYVDAKARQAAHQPEGQRHQCQRWQQSWQGAKGRHGSARP